MFRMKAVKILSLEYESLLGLLNNALIHKNKEENADQQS